MKKIKFLIYLHFVCCMIVGVSCSEEEPENSLPPVITLDHESQIYKVKVGESITISPKVENAGDEALYLWKIDGKIVGEQPTFTYRAGDEPEMVYVKIEVTTAFGFADMELLIEVVPFLKPEIAMGIPEDGFSVIVEGELPFNPEISNSKNATFKWEIDGKIVAETKDYTFSSAEAGLYTLSFTATNQDGFDKVEFKVKVCTPAEMPFTALFEKTDYNMAIGRTIFIRPYWIKNAFGATYAWSVDGNAISTTDPNLCLLAYTPTTEGKHIVTLKMTNHYGKSTMNFTVNVSPVEGTYRRSSTGSVDFNKVYEFKPAAGQFVNENYTVYTMDEANAYVTQQMQKRAYASLGGWGGYIVVGFDHSIENDGDYNLQILGNAFKGSSEPGIVSVMQDENGNGLPDDTWYELKGSDYATSIKDYAVTYFRPDAAHKSVPWVDNQGNSGQVDYLGFHTQDYYYPNWIKEDSYTLIGSRLTPKTVETSPGYWANGEFDWGYVDNFSPIDRLTNDDNYNANVMGNHMKISDAVRYDGKPANLKYIDFVKVHTGVNVKAGWLGENSTEVFGVQDYNLVKKSGTR